MKVSLVAMLLFIPIISSSDKSYSDIEETQPLNMMEVNTISLTKPSIAFQFNDKNIIELSESASRALLSNPACRLFDYANQHQEKITVHMMENIHYNPHLKTMLETIGAGTDKKAFFDLAEGTTLDFNGTFDFVTKAYKFLEAIKGYPNTVAYLQKTPIMLVARLIYEKDFKKNNFKYLTQRITNKASTNQSCIVDDEFFIKEFVKKINTVGECLKKHKSRTYLHQLYLQLMNTADYRILSAALQLKEVHNNKYKAHLCFIEFCLKKLSYKYDMVTMAKNLDSLGGDCKFWKEHVVLKNSERTFTCSEINQLEMLKQIGCKDAQFFPKYQGRCQDIFLSCIKETERIKNPEEIVKKMFE